MAGKGEKGPVGGMEGVGLEVGGHFMSQRQGSVCVMGWNEERKAGVC